jgi:hypothetical protein
MRAMDEKTTETVQTDEPTIDGQTNHGNLTSFIIR